MKIKDSTVLITGGVSGIGKIMGRLCLEKGAGQLIVWDINETALASLKEEFSHLGRISCYRVDVSDPDSVDEAYRKGVEDCGPVDILINNAGIITNNKHFFEQTDSDIMRTMRINAEGPMFVALRALRDMRQRGSGHICNITSAAGMLAMPRMSLYAASKWAAIGWSESMRIELEREKSGVKVTTFAPYFINTGMFDGIRSVFKIQEPEAVAAKALKAVEKNRPFQGKPFTYHFIRLMQGLFPFKIFDPLFGDVFGLYRVMDHYTGRKPSSPSA